MKHTNIAKRALACGLAFALVVTGAGFSSIDVAAKKSKSKAKLNKAKVSVIAGSTTTLKVKKAKKKVKWSTSNKKVVKITKTSGKKKENVTVQGIKKGSAVVTAKVGKQKLKCKVKVQANKIKSVSVDKLDYSALTVKFTKKTPLNVGDVKIAVKAYKSGSYNLNPKVEALSTKDQKTYRLYLTSSVPLNAYVQVKQGKYIKEVQNKQSFMPHEKEVTFLLEKEVVFNRTLKGCFRQAVGDISCSLKKGNKLPKGLSLVGKRGIIKGIPSVAGETKVTLIAKDEAGRKANLSVTFKVYDETTIAAGDSKNNKVKLDDCMADVNASMLATPTPGVAESSSPTYNPVSGGGISLPIASLPVAPVPLPSATAAPTVTVDPTVVFDYYDIEPKGGSGSYKYDVVQTGTDAVKLNTDIEDAATHQITKKAAASARLYIPYGLGAGVHTYTINITDAADAARVTTATIEINVIDNFNISGTVKDSKDSPLSGHERIYFYPEDAVNGADYVARRTYQKYQNNKLVAGNHHSGYGYDDYESLTSKNGDEFDVYYHNNTSVVGPYPIPTILTEEPTPTPAGSSAAPANPAASPTATPYKVADLEAGNYAAEVPAGTYTVKVEGNNGVAYELDDKVTVSADAIGAANLTMPVRFANVTATAKFANDKAIANDRIYFETENRQYEWWTFAVRTNYLGAFTASIPAGTYKMYWLDEDGKAQYFTNDVKVEEATDVNLGDQKLAVSRYEVTGTFKIHEINVDGAEVDVLAPGETLYFYDANGNVKTIRTKYDSSYDAAAGKRVEGPKHGTFDKLLLDNGTYTVRYSDSSYYDDDYVSTSTMRTIGTVAVNGADVKQDFVFNSLSAGITAEFANAAALTLEQESVMASTGNNDLLARFVIPDTADMSSVNYDVSVKLNGNQSLSHSIAIYKESGDATKTYTWVGAVYDDVATIPMMGGTYVMRLTPYKTDGTQVIGNVNVKVSKHLRAYEKSSTALTLNTPATLACAKNVKDDDLKYVAYAKIAVEANKTYVVNYASKTIGVNDIDVRCVSGDIDKLSSPGGASMGSGTYTFTANSSGDVYLEFATYDTIYSTIDVTATEQAPVAQ